MTFDFRNPDYGPVFQRRIALLQRIRTEPGALQVLQAYYRTDPVQFVNDWGMTYDPRNLERGLPAMVPFLLFPKQRDWLAWVVQRWRAGESGLSDKSRDMGVSWLMIALSCSLCLHVEDMAIGFGSRKEEYVDKLDSPKSLFYKARLFMRSLPQELRGGWDEKKHAPYMRIVFPNTRSVMTGEAGDNIGRGDRTALYFVDEAAHLERPQLVDESLSATTNCRIDVSSVKGMANPFAVKRHSWEPSRIFTLHWRDDPRKSEQWYRELRTKKGLDEITIAQEYDINYTASVSGVVIPSEWVQAAIDAHVKLGLTVSGARSAGLDVADEGPDLNAYAGRHGILLEYVESWSGAGSDIYKTTERALTTGVGAGYLAMRYDSDGLGVGVRGDAAALGRERAELAAVAIEPFRGSEAVIDPDGPVPSADPLPPGQHELRTNKDYFANRKAQAWWALRLRFLRTYRAVTQGHKVHDPDDLISLSSTLPRLSALCLELSQPTYSENGAGKILIDKSPEGTKSPNLADSVMIAFASSPPKRRGFFG